MKQIDNFEIVKYEFQEVDGEPKIVISMIRANDENGNYIKFIKMKEAVELLNKKQVKFR